MMTIICYLRRFGLLSLVTVALVAGCAGVDSNTRDDASTLPPILTLDEVIRPYVKIGRIQITREVFKTDALNNTDVYDWGTAALRREAAKMGADAIIFPEINGSYVMSVVIPSTEYRATGVAIKFK